MKKSVKPDRLIILSALLLLIVCIYFVFLYKLQIIEGDEYSTASANSVGSIQTVEAARGNILDRYGKLLVYNQQSYNLTLNESKLFDEDDPNAEILRLVNFVKAQGDEYVDTLPITSSPPFEYTDMTSSQKTALNAYLDDKGLDSNTTAVELLSYMRSRYDINNNYSSEDMRTIAGIRYEINVRYADNAGLGTYIFVENADQDLIAALLENDFPEVNVTTTYERIINTTSAPHILGYTGLMTAEEYQTYKANNYSMNAQVGKTGVEKGLESYLHGTDGQVTITTREDGTITDTIYNVEPEPGDNVYLTLDIQLQEAVEKALGEGVEELADTVASNLVAKGEDPEDDSKRVTGGAAVVVQVDTGEPLAIASYPTYDLTTIKQDYSKLVADEDAPLFNRATMGTYAPGSTFKPCTAIAALTEGIIDSNSTVVCNGVFTKYASTGYEPVCWIWSSYNLCHGGENVVTAIRDSCNIFFYTMGDELGIDKLGKYGYAFGLGSSTGIEIDESVGNMANKKTHKTLTGDDWYAGDNVQAAIGQSDNLFTPLQLAEYCATVANGGNRHTASLLKAARTYDYSSTTYDREATVLSSIESATENWENVREGMRLVAADPSGSAYDTFGTYWCSVGCKTGTAQTGSSSNNGCFICFAPFDDPQIAVAVVVEHAGAGADIAPIAKAILDAYFDEQALSNEAEKTNSLLK